MRTNFQRFGHVQSPLEVRGSPVESRRQKNEMLKYCSYGLKRYMESTMIREDGTVVFDIRLPGRKLA